MSPPAPPPSDDERSDLDLVTVTAGLEHPWGMAFLPDGRVLVTERPGRLRIIERDGQEGPPIAGVPAVEAKGQGGLLDVALDPAFARNRLVYLSYTEPREGGNGTSVARGVLEGGQPHRRAGHLPPAAGDAGRLSLRVAARVRA